jgi:hypothetical protein
LKNTRMSCFARSIISCSAREAGLSRPWLSGTAASRAEVSTTDFSVSAPAGILEEDALAGEGAALHVREPLPHRRHQAVLGLEHASSFVAAGPVRALGVRPRPPFARKSRRWQGRFPPAAAVRHRPAAWPAQHQSRSPAIPRKGG